MKNPAIVLMIALCGLSGCTKSSTPAAANGPTAASPKSDAVQQKLLEYAGDGAKDCGRLDVHAVEPQLKTTSDCAMQAAQAKRGFYVAYDMPGMAVGIAGNSAGKLFSVQSQGEGSAAALTSGDCPSQLRVASSGRVTCFAPGDMGSMGGGHTGTTAAPGMSNPHSGSSKTPNKPE